MEWHSGVRQSSKASDIGGVTFRKRIYAALKELQADLDEWLLYYNVRRTHQGKRCQGRTTMQTFEEGKTVARSKRLEPMPPPPRMDPEGCSSSKATVTAAEPRCPLYRRQEAKGYC